MRVASFGAAAAVRTGDDLEPVTVRVIEVDAAPVVVQACLARAPQVGTWCEAWTVRDVVVHQTGTATELARVLAGHLEGSPVETRGFEEREAEFHLLDDDVLWQALTGALTHLDHVAEAGDRLPPATDVAWTGRTMKVPWFAEHMREELTLHGWDITGDTDDARDRLAQWWMTTHSIEAVGEPLLQRGARALQLDGDRFTGRLRVEGTYDVAVSADGDSTTIALATPEGDATLETDAATRILPLWGRRPADPGRICSRAGAAALRQLRTLLSGY